MNEFCEIKSLKVEWEYGGLLCGKYGYDRKRVFELSSGRFYLFIYSNIVHIRPLKKQFGF